MAIVASGKPARTDVERVAASTGFAALRCTLHSGRTHQIRVHLAAQGLPLVGDRLYGGAPALGMERQALHARCSASAHPRSGERLAFRIGAAGRLRSRLGRGRRGQGDPEPAPAAAPAGYNAPFPFDAKGSCGGETPGRTPRRDHRDVTAPEGASNRGGPPRRTRRVPRRARPPRRDAAEDFTTT